MQDKNKNKYTHTIRREENTRLEKAGFQHYFDDAGYPRCRCCHAYWYAWKAIMRGNDYVELDCCKCGAYEAAPRERRITY